MAESFYVRVFFAHQDSNFLQEELGVNSLFHVLQILQGIDLKNLYNDFNQPELKEVCY